jgi:hypothetical protein
VLRGLAMAPSVWPPVMANRAGYFLGLSLDGGEVHHQDPLRLGRGLLLWRHVWLDRSSGLLTGELASPWHYLLLSGGSPSLGLCSLPPMKTVPESPS